MTTKLQIERVDSVLIYNSFKLLYNIYDQMLVHVGLKHSSALRIKNPCLLKPYT